MLNCLYVHRHSDFDHRGSSGRGFDDRATLGSHERRVERYDRRDGTALDNRDRFDERRADPPRRDVRDIRRDPPPARDRDDRRFEDRRPVERSYDR